MPLTIAIDGPAAAGKGTIARQVADKFGLAYLDTGLLYRAVAARVLDGEAESDAARALVTADLERANLRSREIGRTASQVAANPEVRAALLDFQRAFAQREGGAVLDGRDIGTVICPDATVKVFVTASDEIRAQRRWRELAEMGGSATLEQVTLDLKDRDRRDSARSSAPMMQAADAVVIDTTNMSIEEAVEAVIALIPK